MYKSTDRACSVNELLHLLWNPLTLAIFKIGPMTSGVDLSPPMFVVCSCLVNAAHGWSVLQQNPLAF